MVEGGREEAAGLDRQLVAGPLRHAEGILTVEIDLSHAIEHRRLFDPVGHYHRPDVFQLSVDTRPARGRVTDWSPADGLG